MTLMCACFIEAFREGVFFRESAGAPEESRSGVMVSQIWLRSSLSSMTRELYSSKHAKFRVP